MSRNKEIELKLCRIGKNDLLPLLEDDWEEDQLEAYYYDTADLALFNSGLTYRIRCESGCWVATIKTRGTTTGGLSSRQEFNVNIKERVPAIEYFSASEIGDTLKNVIGTKSLQQLFQVAVVRRSRSFQVGGTTLEACLDIGSIITANTTEEIYELELELKDGKPQDVIEFALGICRKVPLRVESRSKFLRGMILTGHVDSEAIDNSPQESKKNSLLRKRDCTEVIQDRVMRCIDEVMSIQSAYLRGECGAGDMFKEIKQAGAILWFAKQFIDKNEYECIDHKLHVLYELFLPLKRMEFVISETKAIFGNPSLFYNGRHWLDKRLAELYQLEQTKVDDYLQKGLLTVSIFELWHWLNHEPWLARTEKTLDEYMTFRLQYYKDQLLQQGKTVNYDDKVLVAELYSEGCEIIGMLETVQYILHKDEVKIYEKFRDYIEYLTYLYKARSSQEVVAGFITPSTSRLLYMDIGLLLGWQTANIHHVQQKLEKKWRQLRKILKKI